MNSQDVREKGIIGPATPPESFAREAQMCSRKRIGTGPVSRTHEVYDREHRRIVDEDRWYRGQPLALSA